MAVIGEILLPPLLPPPLIIFGATYAGSPVAQDKPVVMLKAEVEVQPAGKVKTAPQDIPVVLLKPVVEVQPNGKLLKFELL